MRSKLAACLGLMTAAALFAPPAHAAPSWQPREEAADVATGSIHRVFLGADKVAKVFGDPEQRFPTQDRLGLRPVGGPLGAFAPVAGPFTATVIGSHDAAGNMLIADGTRIAFRPAGTSSAVGAVQELGGGNEVNAIAMTTTGEALVQIGHNPLRVAFRPAGPNAQVDVANAQTLPGTGASDVVVGMALDPTGAAVVVYRSGNSVLQTTRPAGSTSFASPVAISPGGTEAKYRVHMDSTMQGWAILTWAGQPPSGPDPDRAVASVRAPGGAFPTPAGIGSDDLIFDVIAAVDGSGHAVAMWNDKAAIYDGAWGSGASLGPGGGAGTGTARYLMDGEGSTIAVPTGERFENADPGDADDTSRLVVHRATVTPDGFKFVEHQEIQASVAGPSGQVHPAWVDLSVEPGGRILTAFTLFPKIYLRAFEDPADAPAPGGGGDPDPGPGSGGDGSTPPSTDGDPRPTPPLGGDPPPFILPIVPVNLVIAGPLDPVRPRVTVKCPPEAGSECLVTINLRLGFGANPKAAAKRKGVRIGTGRGTVAPAKSKKIRLKLNRAGRKVVKRGRSVKVKVETTIRVGAQKGSVTKSTRLKARKRRHR